MTRSGKISRRLLILRVARALAPDAVLGAVCGGLYGGVFAGLTVFDKTRPLAIVWVAICGGTIAAVIAVAVALFRIRIGITNPGNAAPDQIGQDRLVRADEPTFEPPERPLGMPHNSASDRLIHQR